MSTRRVHLIDLNAFPMECFVCEEERDYSGSMGSFGWAVYEDLLLPDDWTGEWFGHHVCGFCHLLCRCLVPVGSEPQPVGRLQRILREEGAFAPRARDAR